MPRSARFAGLAVLGLWLAEVGSALVIVLDVLDVLGHLPGPGTAPALRALAGGDFVFGAVVALETAALLSLLGKEVPFDAQAWSPPVWRAQGFTALSLAALVAAAATARAGHGTVPLFIAAAFTGLAATLAALAALVSLPRGARGSTLFVAGLAASTGLVTGGLVGLQPPWLQTATLAAVDRVARAVFTGVVSDLDAATLKVGSFRVRIEPDCSGIESLVLGLAFLSAYLVLSRERLRFPRALLVLPIALVALFASNVLRIVALLAVGRHSPRGAVDAFHSSAGWVLFAATLGVVVPLTERILGLRCRPREEEPREGGEPVAPFLAPFVALTAAAFVLTALSLDATPVAVARYGAALLAALLWPLARSSRAGRFALTGSLAAGAGIAAMYVLAGSPAAAASATIEGPIAAFPSALALLGYVFVTPYVEELAFRGYLLRRLQGRDIAAVRYEDAGAFAVLVSSLLFGALHGSWLLATGAGVVFALVARRFGGLLAAVVAHCAANGLLVAFAAVADRPDFIR